jgi:hypothetical protein
MKKSTRVEALVPEWKKIGSTEAVREVAFDAVFRFVGKNFPFRKIPARPATPADKRGLQLYQALKDEEQDILTWGWQSWYLEEFRSELEHAGLDWRTLNMNALEHWGLSLEELERLGHSGRCDPSLVQKIKEHLGPDAAI